MRVVFFGSSDTLLSARHFDALAAAPCQIAAVVDVPVGKTASTNQRGLQGRQPFVEWARERGVPVFAPASPDTPDFVAALRALSPDLFVAAGYTNRLRAEVLSVPIIAAANFHASLLPAYRGLHPLFWALRHDEARVGMTVHVMAPALDAGDILYQVSVRTRRHDSVASLYDRVMDRSVPLVARLIDDAAAARLRPAPQKAEGASYFSATRPEDFRLDPALPARTLRRWVFATPGKCYVELDGCRYYALAARAIPHVAGCPPGTLLESGKQRMAITTVEGALRITRYLEEKS